MRDVNDRLIARIILASLANSGVVLFAAGLLTMAGVWALLRTPVDALPDLGDVQVIIRTSYPGHAPGLVEDQVTFPLTTAMLGVPRANTVRGLSMFGDSFVHVLFADGTDPFWARTRVAERLSQVASRLPDGVRPELGPEASGVGWVYEYALVDRTGGHDLSQLRALQDWLLRFELQAVPGVAEVATIGGMVREYQVVLDPDRLRSSGVTLAAVRFAIQRGNAESGGSVIELAEAEMMVRATGYVRGVQDLRLIPVGADHRGLPLTLGDVADIHTGPQARRGVADLDGEGEVVGGVVVMRSGENARATIAHVRQRLAELAKELPEGVEIVPTYDRAGLIDRAVDNLSVKLLEEFVVVLLVCLAFLLHLRSGVVVVIALPLGMLFALLIMRMQGITANIMSLGGIAIAVGVMVDAAIVMVENLHRRLESGQAEERGRLQVAAQACTEVGPALFVSLLIVALSFVPVLALEGQEGRLFAPLAYTKTYAMLAAALLSITVVPVLATLLIRGAIRPASDNPLNRLFAAAYAPLLRLSLARPWQVVIAATVLVLITAWPASRLATEFMPAVDEGDLLYMPTTLPAISADAAGALLQRTDQLIRAVPEVERVFGKAGRAETATDPAPLEMFETIVVLKPRSEWRPGLTLEDLKADLRAQVDLPALSSTWTAPIRARIDMLATGIRTPLGVKIVGPDAQTTQEIAARIEGVLKEIPGIASAYAERPSLGRYIIIDVDRSAAARFGFNVADVHDIVASAIGGSQVSEAIEGRERYPISVRYPPTWRDSAARLEVLPIIADNGAQIALRDVASVRVVSGPALIRSENARPVGLVSIDPGSRDLGSFVAEARERIAAAAILPAQYHLVWSGQYEYLQRAMARLKLVVPLVIGVIIVMLFLNFRSWADVALVLGSLPVALVGGVWLLWALDYAVSVAVVVGIIALAGVAAETGIVMLLYLNAAWAARRSAGTASTSRDLEEAIVEGALKRLRPKLMTVLTIILGLLPLLVDRGTGSEIMRRIAAPMIGGMISTTVLTLAVVPSLFLLIHRKRLNERR